MPIKGLKRQLLKKKLLTKNRLIILNEDSFEEIFSLRLTLLNVFVVATLGAIIIISLTTFLIAFTPLKEFIPGFASSELKKNATELALKSDSLSFAIKKNEAYLASIIKVLNGDLEYEKVNKDSILAVTKETFEDIDLAPTEAEIQLREEVLEEDRKANPKKEKSK
jgi:hypothetical protein